MKKCVLWLCDVFQNRLNLLFKKGRNWGSNPNGGTDLERGVEPSVQTNPEPYFKAYLEGSESGFSSRSRFWKPSPVENQVYRASESMMLVWDTCLLKNILLD